MFKLLTFSKKNIIIFEKNIDPWIRVWSLY